MIIVTGSITAQVGHLEALLALSRAHVQRSRDEPGCVSHAVHHDAENPLRLVFFEEWTDREALRTHFAVPASREFVKAAAALAAGPPSMRVYEAEPVRL